MQPAELIRIIDKFNNARSVLILTPPQAHADDLAAGLALQAFLEKLDKETTLLSPGFLPDKFGFLPNFSKIKTALTITKDFVIDVSTKQTLIDELSYKKENEKLSIFIKPKQGQFTPEDVTFRTSSLPFDLIACLGLPSLDSLGNFYSQNTELFFETTVINIDCKPTNENYAQINAVDLSATSNSEIIFDLINGYESSLLDQQIATMLLTGIISETNSFQHARTTPAAFLKASQLVSLGANQQEIVSRLYKTKTLAFLKLWGRVLARLKQEPALSLVYSVATAQDLEKSEAQTEDIKQIIKEMSFQLSFAKIFLFLVETAPNQIEVFSYSQVPLNLMQLFAPFKPEVVGSIVHFQLNLTLNDAEQQIVGKFREVL